jgi:hypothetical protein
VSITLPDRLQAPNGDGSSQQVTEREHHLHLDSLGPILAVVVRAADIWGNARAQPIARDVCGSFSLRKMVWAHGNFAQRADWAALIPVGSLAPVSIVR